MFYDSCVLLDLFPVMRADTSVSTVKLISQLSSYKNQQQKCRKKLTITVL
jgi:hypothetical protein